MSAINKVESKNKIKIENLPEVFSINEISDFIDVSDKDENSSKRLNITSLYNQHSIVNNGVAARYSTNDRKIEVGDLSLFTSDPNQLVQSDENDIAFETNPIINNPTINGLMTKGNIESFEDHEITTNFNKMFSYLPVYNWENETRTNNGISIPVITSLSDFNVFMTSDKNLARSTYKIPYNNRISNTINMGIFNKKGVIYYSIIGLLSVKSSVSNQKSGTIYLEARKNGDSNAEWETIDSAVFKFFRDETTGQNISPGTYVTLSGYLTSDFETRLKLNLHSQAYSMNMGDYKETKYAILNKYANTFVGFAYFPNGQ